MFYFRVFGAGGGVFPWAGGLFPLFGPEGFPVLLGALDGVTVSFDISLKYYDDAYFILCFFYLKKKTLKGVWFFCLFPTTINLKQGFFILFY